jgi:hypothetical protein
MSKSREMTGKFLPKTLSDAVEYLHDPGTVEDYDAVFAIAKAEAVRQGLPEEAYNYTVEIETGEIIREYSICEMSDREQHKVMDTICDFCGDVISLDEADMFSGFCEDCSLENSAE